MTAEGPNNFCFLCWQLFADIQTHHAVDHPFYCAFCDCDFASDDALQHHLMSATSHNANHVARANYNGAHSNATLGSPYQQVQRREEMVLGGPEIYGFPSDSDSDNFSDDEAPEDQYFNVQRNERSVVVVPNNEVVVANTVRDSTTPHQQELESFLQLWRETATLQQQRAMTYKCSICLEELRLDSGRAIRLSPCNHIMCRECLRSSALSNLQERRYPLRCPDCIAENRPSEENRLSESTISILHLDDKSLQIYNELQLEQLAVRLYCNRCERSIYIPEREFQPVPFFNCAFCRHRWCGHCSQGIGRDENGRFVPHSCDGFQEFEYLRARKGWKACPNPSCRATVEKTTGCNELNCRCGRTFCYGCGIQRERHERPFPCSESTHPPHNAFRPPTPYRRAPAVDQSRTSSYFTRT